MSFPRYPKYKDSGVEWLGEVPEHWVIQALRHQIERNDGGVWGQEPIGEGDTLVLRSTDQTADGRWRVDNPAMRSLNDRERKAALLVTGDLLVTKSSGSALHIGKTTIVDEEIAGLKCCFSNFMQRVRTRPSLLPRFAWYFLNSQLARFQFDLASNSTTGLANLNGGMIGRLMIPLATMDEQETLVELLDQECSKIDALITEQERLIELLKEKRQAFISHAVTKGLNPNAPMKGSGVEWLGEVPQHWEVQRIGSLFRETVEPGVNGLPILSVSIHDGVSDKEMSDDELERKVTRSDDRSKYVRVRPGDLVYNMMRAWQGGFGCVTVEGMVSPAYVVARPRTTMPTQFVEHLLRTPAAIEQMRRYSKGITDFRLRLYWDEFKNLRIVLPPAQEAQQICDHVAEMDHTFSETQSVNEDAIALLQERRTALISAAVTGQIDVRGAAQG